ncbi:MAG: ABC transporter ATP-binding protein [Paracoccaceae bacterium]
MILSNMLEDFGGELAEEVSPQSIASSEQLEEEKLKSFDTGYRAGWDDAVKAQTDINRHIAADLAANLQEISFTYHEVRASLTRELEQVLRPVIDNLLPGAAHAALGAKVIETVKVLGRAAMDCDIEVVVAPASKEPVARMLEDDLDAPFQLTAEEDLSEGQVFIRIGAQERELNVDKVLSETQEAVAAFFDLTKEETRDE